MSIYSRNTKIENGLSIAGVSAKTLAQEYGTPLFVIDEDDFRFRAQSFKNALEKHFGSHAGTVYYASKAFLNKEIARWVESEGLGIDVATGGELASVLASGFPAERITMHGNNKSEEEITSAIKAGVGIIALDSHVEIERVARIASNAKKIQNVIIRVTPGVEAHTHEFIATAHEDQKFGFSLATGAAWRAIEEVQVHTSLNLIGLHAHIGSQIFSAAGYELAAERLLGLMATFRDHYDTQLQHLDIGGGFGVAYLPEEQSVDIDSIFAKLAPRIESIANKLQLHIPKISIEPGRAIAAPTTTTLYTVGTTKNIELDGGDSRRYIAVDGGFIDNLRPALYGAKYHCVLANRTSTSHAIASRVVGKHCESGDILIRDINLPEDVAPGDLLAVPVTGAYGRMMANNYNHLTRPAVVAVKDGKASLIVRRESIDDILALEL